MQFDTQALGRESPFHTLNSQPFCSQALISTSSALAWSGALDLTPATGDVANDQAPFSPADQLAGKHMESRQQDCRRDPRSRCRSCSD